LRDAVLRWHAEYESPGNPGWPGDGRAQSNAAALESAAAVLSQALDERHWDLLEEVALREWKSRRDRRDRTAFEAAAGYTGPHNGDLVGQVRRWQQPDDFDRGAFERWVDETYPDPGPAVPDPAVPDPA
jgi:hypothetical protein